MATDLEEVSRDVGTAQQLPANIVLLKMENESMMAAAAIRPRSPAKIVKQLAELIEAFPASADDAVYSKPVGKVKRIECGKCPESFEVSANKKFFECPKCGHKGRGDEMRSVGRDVMKFAEGLSIRAAETVRAIFGYTRLATTTEILDNGSARVTGMFVDYAAGNITSDERIVPNYYTSYSGERTLIAEDRFLNLTVKAEKAKLRRDIILDSVPNEVKAAYTDMCEKKLAAMVTPEIVQRDILPWFAARGITLEHLEKMIGRTLKMGWTEEDRLLLKKTANGIKNDEITVAELLRDIDGAAEGDSRSAVGSKFGKDKETANGSARAAGTTNTEPAKSANNDVRETTSNNAEQPGGAPADAWAVDWLVMIADCNTNMELDTVEATVKGGTLVADRKLFLVGKINERRKALK